MVRNVSRTALSARRAGPAVVLLALSLAAAACQTGRPGNTPQATVPKAVGTNPTPATRTAYAPADPYTVPSVITKAYVQKVLNALDQVDAGAARLIVASGTLSPNAAAQIRAVTTAPEYTRQTSIILAQLRQGISVYKAPPGAVKDTVTQLVSTSPNCIFAASIRDYSALLMTPPPSRVNYFVLRPQIASPTMSGLNPTPWAVDSLEYNPDNSQPTDPCA